MRGQVAERGRARDGVQVLQDLGADHRVVPDGELHGADIAGAELALRHQPPAPRDPGGIDVHPGHAAPAIGKEPAEGAGAAAGVQHAPGGGHERGERVDPTLVEEMPKGATLVVRVEVVGGAIRHSTLYWRPASRGS